MGGKIAVVSVLTGNNAELAKDVCTHVAAMNPRFLDSTRSTKSLNMKTCLDPGSLKRRQTDGDC